MVTATCQLQKRIPGWSRHFVFWSCQDTGEMKSLAYEIEKLIDTIEAFGLEIRSLVNRFLQKVPPLLMFRRLCRTWKKLVKNFLCNPWYEPPVSWVTPTQELAYCSIIAPIPSVVNIHIRDTATLTAVDRVSAASARRMDHWSDLGTGIIKLPNKE